MKSICATTGHSTAQRAEFRIGTGCDIDGQHDVSTSIKVLLFGRKAITADVLQWLACHDGFDLLGVVTDSHLQGSPTASMAQRLNVPILSHTQAESGLQSGSLRPDLGVSILYWRKFGASMLMSDSACGLINFHPAPLPDFKGCGGYNFAILEQRRDWASTAHYVDATIDTGPIIDVQPVSMDPAVETAVSLEQRTLIVMADQVRLVLERVRVARGRLPTTPNIGGRYITRAEMLAAMKVHPEDDVSIKARAFFFPPYEGAWIEVNGVRCTLLTAALLRLLSPPGTTSLLASRQPPSSGPV
jgi:methionyl-tRNA formyltransferase